MADSAIRPDTATPRVRTGAVRMAPVREDRDPALVPIPRSDHRNDSTHPSAPQLRGPATLGLGGLDGEPDAVISADIPLEALTAVASAMVSSGSRGAEVRKTQRMLADAGYDPGPVDGVFGPKTRAAVIAFQRDHGLVADGIVGPKTTAALKAAQSGSTVPDPPPTPPRDGRPGSRPVDPAPAPTPQQPVSRVTVRSGSRGAAVTDLQRLLTDAGYSPGPIDGVFGSKTRAAVLAFQRANGLVPDGIVGPKTWGALTGDAPPKPPASGTVADFLRYALAQSGDTYLFGAETRLDDPNPTKFDCSELVQWACAQAGVYIPDGSWNQEAYCKTISVEEAMRTPGALLFTDGHVAISLGDGTTIEARGRNWGVGSWPAAGRFTSGGLIPGMT